MTRHVMSVDDTYTVLQAARIMATSRVGGLIVLRRSAPIGMITQGDMIAKVVSLDRQPGKVLVRDVMASPLLSIPSSTTIQRAAEKMAALRVRRFAVVDDGALVGVVSERDIVRRMPSLVRLTSVAAEGMPVQEPEKVGRHA